VNHPDTNESLEISLPHWDEIVSKIQDILSYLPQLTYVGFDIVITDQGFNILEINSLTSINGISYYYPYFADEYSREYFINKFSKRPEKFKRVLEQLKEMERKA
jgi:glutathione synthase/RimK-type ligase-like ATP-grasp enzyme